MIKTFVDLFVEKQNTLFLDHHPASYETIVEAVVRTINPDGNSDGPDLSRIHQINDGDYQGTLVFVIAAGGYQPYEYWFVRVWYGSCSGCDSLEAIHHSAGGYKEMPTAQQAADYQMLALHIVQELKSMQD